MRGLSVAVGLALISTTDSFASIASSRRDLRPALRASVDSEAGPRSDAFVAPPPPPRSEGGAPQPAFDADRPRRSPPGDGRPGERPFPSSPRPPRPAFDRPPRPPGSPDRPPRASGGYEGRAPAGDRPPRPAGGGYEGRVPSGDRPFRPPSERGPGAPERRGPPREGGAPRREGFAPSRPPRDGAGGPSRGVVMLSGPMILVDKNPQRGGPPRSFGDRPPSDRMGGPPGGGFSGGARRSPSDGGARMEGGPPRRGPPGSSGSSFAPRPAFGARPRTPGSSSGSGDDAPASPGFSGRPNTYLGKRAEVKKPGLGPNLDRLPTKKSYTKPKKMDEIRQFRGARGSLKRKKNKQGGGPSFKKVDRPVIIADGDISVAALATLIEKSGVDVVKHLMLKLGVLASLTQSIDAATARAVADAFEKKWVRSEAELANDYDEDDDDDDYEYEESAMERGSLQVFDDDADLMPRAPVVTIMGHVDHGKTSLLDALRSTRVAAGEQGGITQAIGAYSVPTPNGPVTFIDTPGHAAFAEMRERGANVTDIVILVVAADDGVKQQTVDSIACAKAARVPVVVVINKMDAPGADAARVETELTAYDLVSEKLGGDTMFCRVSAKERTGLTELLEALTLQAELLELKANPNAEASGAVVESNIKQGLGVVATTLIQRGTLNVGDIFVAGAAWGRVRSLLDEKGQQLETAGPSRAVQVVGWQSGIEHIPVAGDAFNVVPDEQTARRVTEARQTIYNEVKASKIRALSGAALASFFAGNDVKEQRDFTVLIKGDTAGSVEALTSSLARIDVQDDVSKVSAKVVYGGVGDVTKSDMAVASVSNAFVLAFNVGAQQAATVDERRLKIKIRYYGIVYDALDDIEARMRKILSPTPDGDLVGTAVVKQLFEIGKLGKVAGCGVLSGYMARSANIRVMSGDEIKFQGKLKTLRNLKTDVSRVDEGSDCGLSFRDWDEIQVGDTVECYDV